MLHAPIQSFTQPKQNNSSPSCSPDTSYVGQDTITDEQAKAFLKNAQSRLKEKDVTFDEIDGLYNEFNKYKSEFEELDKRNFGGKVCNRIRDYYTICDYIKQGDIVSIRNAIAEYDNDKFHIWDVHASVIKKIIKDEESTTLYRNECSSLKSFSDIESLYAEDGVDGAESKPKTFQCSICGEMFTSRKNFNIHKNKGHTHKCGGCNLIFVTQTELTNHQIETGHEN